MPLTSVILKQVKVRIRVEKTGKTYSRSKTYAKVVCEHDPKNLKKTKCRYYLLIGRKWAEASKTGFDKATTLKAEKKILEQLEQELKEKVKKELGI